MHNRIWRGLLVDRLALDRANSGPLDRLVHLSEATVISVDVRVSAASIISVVSHVTVSVHVHLVRLSFTVLLVAVEGARARLILVLELRMQ